MGDVLFFKLLQFPFYLDLWILFNMRVLVSRDLKLGTYGLIESQNEGETSSFLPFRYIANISAELLDNLLWNMQAKTYSLGIELLSCFQEAEELEQLVFILFLNTDTWILNFYLDHPMLGSFKKLLVHWELEVVHFSY